MAWQNYQQQYRYDPVGNILQMRHSVVSNTSQSWTRNYSYAVNNNRLLSTQVGEQAPYNYSYHQHHGFITSLSHLSQMRWNAKDELQQTATQQICTGEAPESTWYTYDGGGERLRKITDRMGGQTKRHERIYLGNVEIYRSYDNAGNVEIERQSLHINDDTGRIALIETRTQGNDEFETQLSRYQFSNHLGSANLELDDNGNIVSYEEYHPYGTTSYQANNASVRATAKRYRYTGMERDEESGLNYHSARYYLPWLGRWLSADPIGIGDGVNVYGYVGGNPILLIDSSGMNGVVKTYLDPSRSAADIAGQFNARLNSVEPGSEAHISLLVEYNGLPGYLQRDVLFEIQNSEEGRNKIEEQNESFAQKNHESFLNKQARDNQLEISTYGTAPAKVLQARKTADRVKRGVDSIKESSGVSGLALHDSEPEDLDENLALAEMIATAVGLIGTRNGTPNSLSGITRSSSTQGLKTRTEQGGKVLGRPIPGQVRKTKDKDKAAKNLAEREGGVASATLPDLPGKLGSKEYDLVSDKYVGEGYGGARGKKPAFANPNNRKAANFFNGRRKIQAKRAIEAAKLTGRDVLFEFQGAYPVNQSVIDSLVRKAQRAGVKVKIIVPFLNRKNQ